MCYSGTSIIRLSRGCTKSCIIRKTMIVGTVLRDGGSVCCSDNLHLSYFENKKRVIFATLHILHILIKEIRKTEKSH